MCFLRNTLCYKVKTGTPVASLLDNNFPTCGIGRGEDKEGLSPRGRYRCRYGGARHRDLMVNLLGISAEQRVFELTPLV
jgi:hypothetical protein